MALAILPFLLFYGAWGLVGEQYDTYSVSLLNTGGRGGRDRCPWGSLGRPWGVREADPGCPGPGWGGNGLCGPCGWGGPWGRPGGGPAGPAGGCPGRPG